MAMQHHSWPSALLVATGPFKGTLKALEVASALAEGARTELPNASFEIVPVADGGDGTLETLRKPLGLATRRAGVTGPYGCVAWADWGMSDAPHTAVIETAPACGFAAVTPDTPRDPLHATSRGVGELIAAALDAGAVSILVGLGGSLSTDGGTGAARAMGIRFLDARGRDLPEGGGALRDLERIDVAGRDRRLAGAQITALADVPHRLLGTRGSARVFAPQKGASPAEADILEAGLARLAEVASRDAGVDLDAKEGSGAAGGLGAGLAGFLNARIEPGARWIADRIGLREAVARADAVVTGEGRLDATTFPGKAPGHLWTLARRMGKPCAFVCGSAAIDLPPDVDRSLVFETGSPPPAGPEQAARRVARAAARAGRRLRELSSG